MPALFAPPALFALLALLALLASFAGCRAPGGAPSWRDELDRRLPVLGHRNLIVVADAAYPQQQAGGITTLCTGAEHFEVLDAVLAAIDAAPHVAAEVWLDAELDAVPERLAPGIDAYRAALARTLGARPIERLPHLELIGKLDEAARRFTVLVLKTDLTLPYTSVFLELDCGYWDAAREQLLRAALQQRR